MPDDIIYDQGQAADRLYILLEGKVNILGSDSSAVLQSLGQGRYFGYLEQEFGINRITTVQARSFCIISVLDKKDLDSILATFPMLSDKLKEEAEERLLEMIMLEEKKIIDGQVEREDTIERNFKTEFNTSLPNETESGSLLKSIKGLVHKSKAIERFLLTHFEDALSESKEEISISDSESAVEEVKDDVMDEIQLGLGAIMRQRFVHSPVGSSARTALSPKVESGKVQERRTSIRQEGNRPELKRRLSNLKLGKHLSMSKYSSLKLQWELNA